MPNRLEANIWELTHKADKSAKEQRRLRTVKLEPERPVRSVAWVTQSGNRWSLGGEWYRAYRSAAIAGARFGWKTALCDRWATPPLSGPVTLGTPNGAPVIPEFIIVRPIRGWRRHLTEIAHRGGQKVIADLDDDPWSHEEWAGGDRPNDDYFDEWFPHVDAVLVSTEHLAERVRERVSCPVHVGPNCYDPFGLGQADPHPGPVLGTRLWIGARQSGDLELYDRLVLPLLEDLDLKFCHIGAGDQVNYGNGPRPSRLTDRGWPEDRLIELPSHPMPQMHKALEHISIGVICMSDQPYNRAKTETHAVELTAAGLPIVAASEHPLYKGVPGRVESTPEAVRARVLKLLDPKVWAQESARARTWATELSAKREAEYLAALSSVVEALAMV